MSAGEKLLVPVLAVGLLTSGCGVLDTTPQSLNPASIPRCEMPARTTTPLSSMGALMLKPDAQGGYRQVPTASKAHKEMASDVIVRVKNEATKVHAIGVAVNKWMLVTSDVIFDGAKDITDLTVEGSSRSAAVYEVCSIPEYDLVKIQFGRTVSQGSQFIELAEQQVPWGGPVIAMTRHGDRYPTVGGLMLNNSILSGIDATSRDGNGRNAAVDSNWAVGAVVRANETRLQGLLLPEQSLPVSSEGLHAENIQLDASSETSPTKSPVLGYDATWQVVHATMPK